MGRSVEAKALVFANSIEVSCLLYEDVICRHSATTTIVIADDGTPFVNELYIEHRKTLKFYVSLTVKLNDSSELFVLVYACCQITKKTIGIFTFLGFCLRTTERCTNKPLDILHL